MQFTPNFNLQDNLIRYFREDVASDAIEMDLFGLLTSYTLKARSDVQPRGLDFYSIVHVTQGSAWLWTQSDARTAVSAGDCLLFYPDTAFDFAAATGDATVDCICFNGGLAEHLKQTNLLNEGVRSIGASRRLLSIIRHAKEGTPAGALRAHSALFHLFTELEVERLSSTEAPSRIAALIDAIRQHPEIWRDSHEMAEFCHLSEAQLRRVFKQETGLSPKTFQDTVRAQKAKELLQNGFSVNVVSDLLGYADPFHFSRRFKTLIGNTPRDFLNS
ncbi:MULTISPECIES: AraC family transcriptional regulator [unclassified Lentimonas]|uniref:AraC family transcriptional regulator n=1 Tax=unclassified Lentimonas TaxID=2630993 RepID=UPI00132789C3|nr:MULTISPECIES: AraC family transcriptional regulator [unclassified Lentimonas]CAA6678127.1 Unannotated [Lentimonas sp. CC4]CAA6685984.1 Unannotated [Lentimonas sp. CC6]CAA6691812.1 Unannotated [Lentimonas sp. CC19]CAA6694560.1 Unannotated [Lentimonas sp. CC10]CAA7072101.1 Unannotated [Lentimonas sp. CC11]